MAKVMISLPDELLERIDATARRRSVSRSALLARAAERDLARPEPEEVLAAIRRSEERFKDVASFDATDLIRAERDRDWHR